MGRDIPDESNPNAQGRENSKSHMGFNCFLVSVSFESTSIIIIAESKGQKSYNETAGLLLASGYCYLQSPFRI
jgi:hypothetical protein